MPLPKKVSRTNFHWTDFYLFNAKLGLKWFVKGVNYWRLVEYPWAANHLRLAPGVKILDIGSASYNLLPLLLASDGYLVYATDIDPRLERLKTVSPGDNLVIETADATALPYQEAFFDRVTAISAIEHIPDNGDSLAIRQIARVLKPGGRLVITVPFNKKYRETFVQKGVYSQEYEGKPIFYQRHYDAATLHSRLVEPSGLNLVDIEYFGERYLRFESLFDRLPLLATIPFRWLMPLFTKLFTVKLSKEKLEKSMAACLVLEK